MRKLKSGCIVDIVEYARRAPNEIDISKRNALQERPPGTPSSLSWNTLQPLLVFLQLQAHAGKSSGTCCFIEGYCRHGRPHSHLILEVESRPLPCSEDHKPDSPGERERLEAAGSEVRQAPQP